MAELPEPPSEERAGGARRDPRGCPLLVFADVRVSPGSGGRPSAAGLGGTRAGMTPGRENSLRYGLGAPSHCTYGSPHGAHLLSRCGCPLGGSNGSLVPCPAG